MLKERKKNRLRGFDYSSDRLYFITSCVDNMIPHFGNVKGGKMICNQNGEIAIKQWEWLQLQYPYAVSHGFVVMPNHIHAVIGIRSSLANGSRKIKSISELMGAYKTTSSKEIHLLGCEEFRWKRSFYDHIIRNENSYWNILNYIEKNPENWEKDRFKYLIDD